MTQPTTSRSNTHTAVIIAVAVILSLTASLLVVLVLTRQNQSSLPPPAPSTTAAPTESSSTPPSATSPPAVATPASAEPTDSAMSTATDTPTPSPSTVPTMSVTPSAPAPTAGETMMWEGKATFEYFTVEVPREKQGPDLIEGKAGLLVEVCLTKALGSDGGTRISWDPWTLRDSAGTVQRPQAGGYQPAFPAEGQYEVGECARGYLTFNYVNGNSDYADFVYENGLGDRAVWQFH